MILPGERQVVAEWIEADMPHTCSILRRSETGEDPYRQTTYGEHEEVYTDVPCFFWFTGGGETRDPRRQVIEYEWRLQTPRWVDVREDDRIGNIRDYSGELQHPYDLAIQTIAPRSTNYMLVLRDVRDVV